jgi:hypothetical protein
MSVARKKVRNSIMAESIIEPLEVVEVEEENSQSLLLAAGYV